MKDCVFCKIVWGQIPKEFDYQDDTVVAFRDITPAAPIHLLIIPKVHVEDIYDAENETILAIHSAIKKLVDKLELSGKGYRITINAGGAQIMPHLHFHLRAPMSKDKKL